MKKLASIFAFLLVGGLVMGQTDQGTILLGGSLSLDIQSQSVKIDGDKSDESTNVTTFQIAPNVGIFITDEIAAGATVSFSTISVEDSENNPSTIGIGPFARYYYDIQDNLSLFGQADFRFTSMSTGDDDQDALTGTSWGVGPGLAVFVSESVAIEALLQYRSSTMDTFVENREDLSSGVVFGIGVQAYIGGN